MGVEPVDKDTLRQPPRSVGDTILSRALILKIFMSAVVIISGTLFIFWKEVSEGRPLLFCKSSPSPGAVQMLGTAVPALLPQLSSGRGKHVHTQDNVPSEGWGA